MYARKKKKKNKSFRNDPSRWSRARSREGEGEGSPNPLTRVTARPYP